MARVQLGTIDFLFVEEQYGASGLIVGALLEQGVAQWVSPQMEIVGEKKIVFGVAGNLISNWIGFGSDFGERKPLLVQLELQVSEVQRKWNLP